MSVYVVSQVFRESGAELGSRLVLLVLADAAHNDGVTWISQGEIARLSRLNESHVRDCLRSLEALGELETRKAQRGRRRINVYRVIVPDLAEVDYDRLPFELKEPFTTTADITRSSSGDDRGSRPLTTADLGPNVAATPSSSNRKENRKVKLVAADAATVEPPAVPKLILIDGQNLGYNAIAEVCGYGDNPNAGREIGVALNGSARNGLPVGIRELVWRRLLDEHGAERCLATVAEDPDRFELAVAAAVPIYGRKYRERMPPGSMLTPLALAKRWASLDTLPAGSGGLSGQEAAEVVREWEARRAS